MSERNCTEPSCCNGTQWPNCQQTAGMGPLLRPEREPVEYIMEGNALKGVRPIVGVWENNGSPSHYEDDSPSRTNTPYTD